MSRRGRSQAVQLSAAVQPRPLRLRHHLRDAYVRSAAAEASRGRIDPPKIAQIGFEPMTVGL